MKNRKLGVISHKDLAMTSKIRSGFPPGITVQKQQLTILRLAWQSKGKRVMFLAFVAFIAPSFFGSNQAFATDSDRSQPQNVVQEGQEEIDQIVAQTFPSVTTPSPTEPGSIFPQDPATQFLQNPASPVAQPETIPTPSTSPAPELTPPTNVLPSAESKVRIDIAPVGDPRK